MTDRNQRRLVIRAFHAEEVHMGAPAEYSAGRLTLPSEIEFDHPLVTKAKVQLIKPGQTDLLVNTIMDILPISTKTLGRLGEGVTHTLTGVYVMLTGCDEDGRQMHEFGSSDGNLKDKLVLNKAGTPSDTDYIVHIDVQLKGGQLFDRDLANAAFGVCDAYIANIRAILKKLDGTKATEQHEYYDTIKPGKTKIVLIKQVDGQGAMYVNMLFPSEPSGFDGVSIIDVRNMPVILSPNEYRDGAIRALV